MNMHKTENVFHNRNFRLVFLGALVSELGALLYSFAVSFYMRSMNGGKHDVSTEETERYSD